MTIADLFDAVSTTPGPVPPITVESLEAVMKMFPSSPLEEMVIITPSIEALEAEIAATRADCGLFPPLNGIPVVVTRFADRPRLVPRAWIRSHHHIGPVPLG